MNKKAAPVGIAGPTQSSARVESLDVLRGFALLGILMVNIQSFAMPGTAYLNPTAFGNWEGFNYAAWLLVHLFFDSKMMTLFSLLFGAGIVLISSRIEKAQRSPWGIHYRRMFWLLLFGLVHAYLIWYGDILVCYAISGAVVFWLRRWNPKWQLVCGLLMIAVSSFIFLGFGWLISFADAETMKHMAANWNPSSAEIQQEIESYREGYLELLKKRVPIALMMQTFLFAIWGFWRAGGLMLVGMALYRWDVLSAQRSQAFYVRGLGISLSLGLSLAIFGVMENHAHDWGVGFSKFFGSQYLYWSSLSTSFGYLCLVMLACQKQWLGWLGAALQAIGQTALTNYIFQSLICTFLFYGHGLGWFGGVSRTGQLGVVLAIWAIQLTLSPLWLRYFRFGPLEWLWRSLSYWKVQPLTRETIQ